MKWKTAVFFLRFATVFLPNFISRPKCEDRCSDSHVYREYRASNKFLDHRAFYDYYLFSIYSSYARAASRRRMLGNHPHSSNSVKQVILHGTNISWISSNASTLVPSSCIYIYEFFWSLKLKIIFYRYKILILEEFRRIFSHPYDGVHK